MTLSTPGPSPATGTAGGMTPLDRKGDLLRHDAWDGYPAARNRLTAAWRRAEVRNPVVLTGDWHSTFGVDGDRRGRVRCAFDREQMVVHHRMVPTVSRRDTGRYTFASFVVEDGRPGAVQL